MSDNNKGTPVAKQNDPSQKKDHSWKAKKRHRVGPRINRVAISLSGDEKEWLLHSADAAGLKPSQYVYLVLLDRPLRLFVPAHTEALRMVASVSDNLNRVAKAIDKIAKVCGVMLEKVEKGGALEAAIAKIESKLSDFDEQLPILEKILTEINKIIRNDLKDYHQ